MPDNLSHQIFDLKKELPPPADAEHENILKNIDQLSTKIALVLKSGHSFPEVELHQLFQLQEQVDSCAQAGCVLGFIYLMLQEYSAMSDIYTRLIEKHGEHAPFLYYKANAEDKLGHHEAALELLQKLVQTGVKNYWVFMDAARIQRKLAQYKDSIAMANLAVFENTPGSPDPFILLAYNFQAIGEVNRMLECFSRLESLKGRPFLNEMGEIFETHEELYNKVGKLIGKK
ncbi:MAG: hypothetical protein HQL32_02385 [Planctomycetes bacterium]|nr:hypothetical protein [Planctomycetota bacterium]